MHQKTPSVPHAKCTAHTRSGKPCGNDPVTGWKVCRMHGAGGGRPATKPETILRNTLRDSSLRAKAQELLDSGVDVLDLHPVAAQLHILASELAERRDDAEENSTALFLQCIESLRKCAESVERIRASKAFTASERDWVVLSLFDFVEMLPDELKPKFQEFIETRLLLRSSATPKALTVGKSPDA